MAGQVNLRDAWAQWYCRQTWGGILGQVVVVWVILRGAWRSWVRTVNLGSPRRAVFFLSFITIEAIYRYLLFRRLFFFLS